MSHTQLASNIIRALAAEQGATHQDLAKPMGISRQGVTELLKRDLKFSIFQKLAAALGYEIILREVAGATPKKEVRVNSRGGFSIGPAGEEGEDL